MKEYYDASLQNEQLEEGDAVWLYNPQRKKGFTPKLMRPWQGPYVITKKINDLVYRIQQGPKCKPKVLHKNRLWRYTGVNAPIWNRNNASNLTVNGSPPEATAGTMVTPEADQSRSISTKTNSGQVTAKSSPKEDRRGDTPQHRSNNELRRSSRPRRAPTRYGQS